MRAVSRMTVVTRNTINKLLIDLGAACSKHQDKAFRNLSCKRIQCDEGIKVRRVFHVLWLDRDFTLYKHG